MWSIHYFPEIKGLVKHQFKSLPDSSLDDLISCEHLEKNGWNSLSLYPIFKAIFFFFFFLGLHSQHVELPRLGVKSELQLPAYTTAHSNARSLTRWARPGIIPATSWFLGGFVSAEPQQELWQKLFWLEMLQNEIEHSCFPLMSIEILPKEPHFICLKDVPNHLLINSWWHKDL